MGGQAYSSFALPMMHLSIFQPAGQVTVVPPSIIVDGRGRGPTSPLNWRDLCSPPSRAVPRGQVLAERPQDAAVV